MAACILLFSPKCQHSMQLLGYLDANPQLRQIVQLHDVTRHGIPPAFARQITRVPTLLTKNNKLLVGNDVRAWLESLLPNRISNCDFNSKGCAFSSFDGSEDDGGDIFSLDSYGQSLQPAMTPELMAKINKKVT
jgi:hypothetical protein